MVVFLFALAVSMAALLSALRHALVSHCSSFLGGKPWTRASTRATSPFARALSAAAAPRSAATRIDRTTTKVEALIVVVVVAWVLASVQVFRVVGLLLAGDE